MVHDRWWPLCPIGTGLHLFVSRERIFAGWSSNEIQARAGWGYGSPRLSFPWGRNVYPFSHRNCLTHGNCGRTKACSSGKTRFQDSISETGFWSVDWFCSLSDHRFPYSTVLADDSSGEWSSNSTGSKKYVETFLHLLKYLPPIDLFKY